MRHGQKGYKLGRTHSHRQATLAALSNALIKHKRIHTTLPKAKALRMFVEPLITRSKEDTTNNRRQVFRYLQDKESVKEIFGEIAERVAERNGGYTRIVKLGQRAGDAAEMAVIELVDYNETETETTGRRRRRTRRGSGSGGRRQRGGKGKAAAPTAAAVAEEEGIEVVDAEEETAEALPESTAAPEETAAEVTEAPEAEAVELETAEPEIAEPGVAEPEDAAEQAGDEEEKKED